MVGLARKWWRGTKAPNLVDCNRRASGPDILEPCRFSVRTGRDIIVINDMQLDAAVLPNQRPMGGRRERVQPTTKAAVETRG